MKCILNFGYHMMYHMRNSATSYDMLFKNIHYYKILNRRHFFSRSLYLRNDVERVKRTTLLTKQRGKL